MKIYSNALINESSPYLLQHAHNPVQWYPWNETSLALAKEKDLPILVSIGYSACHWCHVMERESFENEQVAEYMNENFVNIKIDREERPDLDQIYMDAVQALSGSGGWPLNVFLTPDGRPFYGGTYFPPKKASNRASWMDVLQSMTNVWKNKRQEAEAQAITLLEHIEKSNNFIASNNVVPATETVSFFSADDCRLIATNLLKTADYEKGGFGSAPKFLQTFSIQYLLQFSYFYKNEKARNHALNSLIQMVNGGIYDQVGGGISRYSTNAHWLVPHFEKMLYDNALLTSVLCDAYQLSKDPQIEAAIHSTLDFVINEMKNEESGFYTALDADSEGIEGKFYVWDKSEIEELTGNDAAVFCDYFNVSDAGNWEGKNILHVSKSVEEFSANYAISGSALLNLVEKNKKILYKARQKRVRPGTDDKIILSVNALLLSAFCRAYAATQVDQYKSEAVELYHFIENNFADNKDTVRLKHTFKNGKAKFPAFLDDYAYYIRACINLQEITSNQVYLLRAFSLTEHVLLHFKDPASSFFYYTHNEQTDIVTRKIDLYDGATPSANSVMAANLSYLSVIFHVEAFGKQSLEMLKGVFNAYKKYPGSFAGWAGQYLLQTKGIDEIVITGNSIGAVLDEILAEYIPNKIIQSSREEINMPLLKSKDYKDNPAIYLCRNYSCQASVSSAASLFSVLYNKGN